MIGLDGNRIKGQIARDLGIPARSIRCSIQRYSMGQTIHIVVNDLKIDLEKVRFVARQFESIRRDETGDILGGGNTFVQVRYANVL